MNKTLYLTSVLETKGARKNNKPLKIQKLIFTTV